MRHKDLRVAFVGAGGIHFGSSEGPGNHAARLERLDSVIPSFIIDPDVKLGERRLDERRQGPYGSKWEVTSVLPSLDDLLEMDPLPCDAVFIAVPPAAHGALEPPNLAMELKCAQKGLHLFVEKPVSLRSVNEVRKLNLLLSDAQRRHETVIAVGYMLRYAAVVQKAKKILKGFHVTTIIATYHCSYSSIEKEQWWDGAQSGGPIIEQATHFADLMRYFGGEVVRESLHTVCVSPEYDLERAVSFEKHVPMNRRIDRATSASFIFKSGAIGSLTHTALLHGNTFDTQIEILADGLRVLIQNPHDDDPHLLVRKPDSMTYEKVAVEKVDMYQEELSSFVKAARTCDTRDVLNSYGDAIKSYELTKWIADDKISR